MPKDKDPLGLLGSGFQTLGKVADPESYRQPMTKLAGLFGRSLSGQPLPKAKKRTGPPGMAPGSMAKEARSQGYDVVKNKDGSESYVKSKPKAKGKKAPAKSLKKGWTVQPDGSFAKTPGADRRGAVLPTKPKKKGK